MNLDDFDDDPENPQHTPEQRAAAGTRSTWVSVGVNLILTITQVAVGILAKSQGLVADGIHSLSDLVADFVVLFSSHHAKKDADEDHPYGHQRFETAASLVLGALLLAVGVGMLWSAFRKLEQPDLVQQVHVVALLVAGGALIAKELLFRYMLSVAMIVVAAHIEVDATISVEAGHDIAVEARRRVLQRHRVLNLMTHVDPWRRPDLDHAGPALPAR